ncbi:MAG: hypothetical protein EZS28_033117 [Streblomastix strix]|uniref:Uncharacterized protein n=1 Tax=Streblomastix strix TaxID=222440 RepID=A0A5J4ULQ9_9EUKA|nr:MAG: hypothetical protein EZS28_033117 [Streblomastix strix]
MTALQAKVDLTIKLQLQSRQFITVYLSAMSLISLEQVGRYLRFRFLKIGKMLISIVHSSPSGLMRFGNVGLH